MNSCLFTSSTILKNNLKLCIRFSSQLLNTFYLYNLLLRHLIGLCRFHALEFSKKGREQSRYMRDIFALPNAHNLVLARGH